MIVHGMCTNVHGEGKYEYLILDDIKHESLLGKDNGVNMSI